MEGEITGGGFILGYCLSHYRRWFHTLWRVKSLVVAFPSLARILRECSTIHSLPALLLLLCFILFLFLFLWRIARTHLFHSLRQDRSTVAQSAETTVAESSKSAGLLIERLRVRIPVGAAGEFSSPELASCADSYSVSVPPPCY